MESVVLGLDAGVLDHGSGVRLQTGHRAADVGVYLNDFLDARGHQEWGGDALLDAEEDAVRGGHADGGAAEFDRFEGVFDLEEAAFGREGARRIRLGVEKREL